MVKSDGSVANTYTLFTATAPDQTSIATHRYSAVALSKGGWVVLEEVPNAQLLFIPAGAGASVAVSIGSNASLQPLLGGGVLVLSLVEGALVRQVFDATGRLATDLAKALAGEVFAPAFGGNTQHLNFDERRIYRVGSSGALEYFDATGNTVERNAGQLPAAASSIPAMLNTSALVFVADPQQTGDLGANFSASLGFYDQGRFAPLLDQRDINTNTVSGSTTTTSSNTQYQSQFRPLNSSTLWFAATVSQTAGSDTFTSNVGPQRISTRELDFQGSGSMTSNVVVRTLVGGPSAATVTNGALATPLLLAMQPAVANGVLGGNVLTPAVEPPTSPVTPTAPSAPSTPSTPATPSNGNAGNSNGGVPVPAGPGSQLELPPPLYLPGTRPGNNAGGNPASPAMGVPASLIINPGDGGAAELLEAARDVVRDALGNAAAVRFQGATTPEERGAILQEAAYAQAIGPELYESTRFMDEEMRGALFNALGTLQTMGLVNDDKTSAALDRALTVKRESTNPDGSKGVSRTALEVPLMILQADLEQAKTPAERERVKARMTREVLIAAREEAGETVDDTADLVLVDTKGRSVRITEEGDVTRE